MGACELVSGLVSGVDCVAPSEGAGVEDIHVLDVCNRCGVVWIIGGVEEGGERIEAAG